MPLKDAEQKGVPLPAGWGPKVAALLDGSLQTSGTLMPKSLRRARGAVFRKHVSASPGVPTDHGPSPPSGKHAATVDPELLRRRAEAAAEAAALRYHDCCGGRVYCTLVGELRHEPKDWPRLADCERDPQRWRIPAWADRIRLQVGGSASTKEPCPRASTKRLSSAKAFCYQCTATKRALVTSITVDGGVTSYVCVCVSVRLCVWLARRGHSGKRRTMTSTSQRPACAIVFCNLPPTPVDKVGLAQQPWQAQATIVCVIAVKQPATIVCPVPGRPRGKARELPVAARVSAL